MNRVRCFGFSVHVLIAIYLIALGSPVQGIEKLGYREHCNHTYECQDDLVCCFDMERNVCCKYFEVPPDLDAITSGMTAGSIAGAVLLVLCCAGIIGAIGYFCYRTCTSGGFTPNTRTVRVAQRVAVAEAVSQAVNPPQQQATAYVAVPTGQPPAYQAQPPVHYYPVAPAPVATYGAAQPMTMPPQQQVGNSDFSCPPPVAPGAPVAYGQQYGAPQMTYQPQPTMPPPFVPPPKTDA